MERLPWLLSLVLSILALNCSDVAGVECPDGEELDSSGVNCVVTECGPGETLENGDCVPNQNPCLEVSCDDDNACTVDTCIAVGGSAECQSTNAADGGACDADGSVGTCSAGTCQPGSACDTVDCSDGDPCTSDSCDPTDGSCTNQALSAGSQCADTPAQWCDADGGCTLDCLQANDCPPSLSACETPRCDAEGSCGTDFVSAGTPCDATGVCNGSGACVECVDADDCADDGNSCTKAVCNAGVCSATPLANGVTCLISGTQEAGLCDGGTCVDVCSGVVCDDGNPCTVDSGCDDGVCSATNVTPGDRGECANGLFCTASQTCSECAIRSNCDTGNPCTDSDCRADNTCAPEEALTEDRPTNSCLPDNARSACIEGACQPMAPEDLAEIALVVGPSAGDTNTLQGEVSRPYGDAQDGILVSVQGGAPIIRRRLEVRVRCEQGTALLIVPGLLPRSCTTQTETFNFTLFPGDEGSVGLTATVEGLVKWEVSAEVTACFNLDGSSIPCV